MGLKDRVVDRGRRVLLSPSVMRLATSDRVMKATEGIFDARTRLSSAWSILLNGHALPNIDPALDEHVGTTELRTSRARVKPTNGGNGAGRVSLPEGSDDMDTSLKERSSLASIGGRDVLEKCMKFTAADNARRRGIYPFFRPLDLNDGPEALINGKRVVMFGSNNYLGLTTHPKVREAAKSAIDRFGTSMTGSRLVNGSMKLHEEFEEKLAAWLGKESALVFTTGYQVNLATCSALLSNRNCVAVIDRNVHASLYDGARLGQAAGARLVRYRHNDAQSLDAVLSKLDVGEGALVITDGVFSAEGEIVHLDELLPVVKKHGARLFVDDAHALGVIGPHGKGTAHHFGVSDDVKSSWPLCPGLHTCYNG